MVGLYTNIPTDVGIEAMRKMLETRKDKTVKTSTLTELLEHVLILNIFQFKQTTNRKFHDHQFMMTFM